MGNIISNYFTEYEDTNKMQKIMLFTYLLLFLLALWLYINTVTGVFERAIILNLFMLSFCLPIMAIDFFADKNKFTKGHLFQFIGLGTPRNCIIGIIVGTIVGLILVSSHFIPLTYSSLAAVPLEEQTALFIFVVIFAPFVEELFFRATLLPTLIGLFSRSKTGKPDFIGVIIAVVFVASFFAFMHFAVYDAEIGSLMYAFIFSVLVSILIYSTKSISAGIIPHILGNLVNVMLGS